MLFELLAVIACGVGTFLLRFLPIWRIRHRTHAPHTSGPAHVRKSVQRFFAEIGPAALSALLLVSLWPFFGDAHGMARMVCALVALAVVYVGKHLTRSLAAPTLLGAATYGVLMYLWTL